MKTLICELESFFAHFTVKYLLFQEDNAPLNKNSSHDLIQHDIFSIRILLLRKDSSEHADARNITSCREKAQTLLEGLHRCAVTPVGLPQVLDDYLASI